MEEVIENTPVGRKKMARWLKATLIALASLLGVVIVAVAVVLWTVLTPSRLTHVVNRLADKYVECETHFDKVDLALFRTFPDVGLKVEGVYVVNPTEGAPSDTVAHIGSLTVGLDVKKFLKTRELTVHQVLLNDVQAQLYVSPTGNANYDIFPSSNSQDTSSSAFNLDSLPQIDLRRVEVEGLNASMWNEQAGWKGSAGRLCLDLKAKLCEGRADADLKLKGGTVGLEMSDSAGAPLLTAGVEGLQLSLNGEGNTREVAGKIKMKVEQGRVNVGGVEMVNGRLQESENDLLCLSIPFKANLDSMRFEIGEGTVQVDDYALALSGTGQLASGEVPMSVEARVCTDGEWQVEPLIGLLPEQYASFADGMDMDARVRVEATVVGTVTDSTLPVIEAQVGMTDGKFFYPQALPYKVSGIQAEGQLHLNMGNGGKSHVVVNRLQAKAEGARVKLQGRADDVLGDMLVDAHVEGSLPLGDLQPLLPDSLPLSASGSALMDVRTRFKMSQLAVVSLEKITAAGTVKLQQLDVIYDSLHVQSPKVDIALQLPAKEHAGKMADVHVAGASITLETPGLKGTIDNPDISLGVNNMLQEQLAAAFTIKLGDAEANMDSMMVSFGALGISGSVKLDTAQANPLRRFNPTADIDMHSAVVYMPALPDAVRLSQFSLSYTGHQCDIKNADIRMGHSDFLLYGNIGNVEQWLEHKDILRADLNLTSSYADVDQLMDMLSGMGTDADSLERMREEDNVPDDAHPFIVPKDIDVTLHTHIKRSVAFGNDLTDVAGTLTINDGVAVLDQMGFVCKAATMQLTALYRSPRPSHLFAALDFHLLDIQIDELLDMIPAVDTLVPMLAAFNGNANFHLAAETYLNARYEPLMSSLKGAAAISGKNLTVLDNNSIAQMAKLMQFKSWKDKDNKIKVDSLDVELTCLNKVVEVYPFILNIGKYQFCASGRHSLDNNCGYHIELLKNPLLAKVGVDIRGNLSNPKISLGQVRYADFYRPDKQGVVEKEALEVKRQIKEALEAKVR